MRPVTTPNPSDPVDLRLLALLAEEGKGAVHEFANRLGMDPREVAARLINLSGTGLPLVVGVECDQQRLRGVVAAASARAQQQSPPPRPTGQPPSSGSGPYRVPGQQSGAPYQPQAAPPAQQQGPSVARIPAVAEPPKPPPNQARPPKQGEPSSPAAAAGPPSGPNPAAPAAAEPALNPFGPPQSAAWARTDEESSGESGKPSAPGPAQTGKVGERLRTTGLEGDPISIRLVEVVDPADFLYTAAGYTLGETERTVVVHTELTNHGSRTYHTLPDQYLVLYTTEGHSIGKAAISLSSRPPHTMGVPAGETVGGHAVYIINERTRVLEVRWLARPDSQQNSLTWKVSES